MKPPLTLLRVWTPAGVCPVERVPSAARDGWEWNRTGVDDRYRAESADEFLTRYGETAAALEGEIVNPRTNSAAAWALLAWAYARSVMLAHDPALPLLTLGFRGAFRRGEGPPQSAETEERPGGQLAWFWKGASS